MLQALLDAGLVAHTAMGQAPLGWQEAWAFGQATGKISEPWEYSALIDMSRAYLSELQGSKDALTIPPNERGDADG